MLLKVRVVVHAQQVVVHEHLPRRVGPRADANRGDLESLRDRLRHHGRHALNHHAKGPGLLQRQRVVEDGPGLDGGAALGAEAAEHADALRREADVAHDGDAAVDELAHRLGAVPAALELDCVAAGLLDEAEGVAEGLVGAGLVAPKGHVTDDEARRRTAPHRLAVVYHVVHRHGLGRVVAQHHHAHAVAHQNNLDARALGVLGRGVVVGGQHGNALALALHVLQLQRRQAALLAVVRGRGRRRKGPRVQRDRQTTRRPPATALERGHRGRGKHPQGGIGAQLQALAIGGSVYHTRQSISRRDDATRYDVSAPARVRQSRMRSLALFAAVPVTRVHIEERERE